MSYSEASGYAFLRHRIAVVVCCYSSSEHHRYLSDLNNRPLRLRGTSVLTLTLDTAHVFSDRSAAPEVITANGPATTSRHKPHKGVLLWTPAYRLKPRGLILRNRRRSVTSLWRVVSPAVSCIPCHHQARPMLPLPEHRWDVSRCDRCGCCRCGGVWP